MTESGISTIAFMGLEDRSDDTEDFIGEWDEAFRAAGADHIQIADLLGNLGSVCGGQRPVQTGAAAEDGLGILVPILAWRRQGFGLLGNLGSTSEPQGSRDR